MRTERPRWYRQFLLEWAIFGAVQVTLLVLNPLAFVCMQFIPHTAAASGIIGINFLQHDGCDQDSEYNHSRNLVGPWINWWAFNNGYHTVHHAKPGLHWTKLPEVHATDVHPHIHPNLEVPNFFTYFFSAYVFPGKRLDYLGNPYSPPEEGPDESWIPGRNSTPWEVSLGAEG
jgi:fatty acid desaturase